MQNFNWKKGEWCLTIKWHEAWVTKYQITLHLSPSFSHWIICIWVQKWSCGWLTSPYYCPLIRSVRKIHKLNNTCHQINIWSILWSRNFKRWFCVYCQFLIFRILLPPAHWLLITADLYFPLFSHLLSSLHLFYPSATFDSLSFVMSFRWITLIDSYSLVFCAFRLLAITGT